MFDDVSLDDQLRSSKTIQDMQKELDRISKRLNMNKERLDLIENKKPLEVGIKFHTDKFPELIPSIEKHGNFYDLQTAENVEVFEGYQKLIPLGISTKLPEGYYAILLPRSSTFKKYGLLLANSTGIIDTTYCGDDDLWMMSVYPTRHAIIPANERLCQFTIVREELFEVVNKEWIAENRGGFGSSDKK